LVRRSQLLAQMHRFDESKKLAERSQFIYRETH
jgi:hypothetical protein